MKQFTLIIASFYGTLAIILGAFGAHALKKLISAEKLISFETGVRYQMYHALALLVVGFFFQFNTSVEKWAVTCIILGVFLFSFSIYFLSFAEYWSVNLKFLGPITPLGGLFMIAGWVLIGVSLIKGNASTLQYINNFKHY